LGAAGTKDWPDWDGRLELNRHESLPLNTGATSGTETLPNFFGRQACDANHLITAVLTGSNSN
jgi:hypothetical protein